MKLWTAQYRYNGVDRFDITVKGKANLTFAPTWQMVNGHKNGTLADEQYIDLYTERMRWTYKNNPKTWQELLGKDEVTLVCFCAAGDFCHRLILKDILVKLGAEYQGEREIPKKNKV